ncbi:MAG: hypothetical protein HYZ37_05060 [Candidatus Solibacter usitatus]|nr:hypothetical protein [Candidatus Solibacter usitatus]
MQPQVTPSLLLPARYILRPGVKNAITCRHKYRCDCRGEPKRLPAPPKPNTMPLELVQREFLLLMGYMNVALKNFPDAQQAVHKILMDHQSEFKFDEYGPKLRPPHSI